MTTQQRQSIINAIIARRDALGWSNAELARRARVSRPQLQAWLAGRVQPSAAAIERLMAALDLEVRPTRAQTPRP